MNADRLPEDFQHLWWIVDAPLFIDDTQVTKQYDVIVNPAYEAEAVTEEEGKKRVTSGSGEIEGVGTVSLPPYLKWVLPQASAELHGRVGLDHSRETERTNTRTMRVVKNAERRLLQLVATYFDQYKHKLAFASTKSGVFQDHSGDSVSDLYPLTDMPRTIVFIDVPPNTPIFPTAIELESGGIREITPHIVEKLYGEAETRPIYGDSPEAQKKFWQLMKKDHKSRVAMEALEEQCGENRIGWIDCRILLSDDAPPFHLHINAGGRYHTGAFGYKFIHRGYKYGCRIVGSLRAGRAISVFAIYET